MVEVVVVRMGKAKLEKISRVCKRVRGPREFVGGSVISRAVPWSKSSQLEPYMCCCAPWQPGKPGPMW